MKTIVLLFLCAASLLGAPAAIEPWQPIAPATLRAAVSKNASFFEVNASEVAVGLPFLKRIEMAGETAILTVRNDGQTLLAPEIEVVIFNRYGMRLCRMVASFASEPVPAGAVGGKTIRLIAPEIEEVFRVSVIKLPSDWKAPRFATVRRIDQAQAGESTAAMRDPKGPRSRPQLVPQQVRPAILSENKFGTTNIGNIAVDARWSNYGAYLQRVIDTVQVQWQQLIPQLTAAPTTGSTVTVKFVMNDEGKISQIVNVDSTANESGARACVSAITNRAPYGPWTDDMKAVLGSRQEMTFTFYYQ